MARLTSKDWKALPASDFVIPSERAYPIPDASHARAALQRSSQFGPASLKEKVRAQVRRKFPGIEQHEES